MGIGMSHSPWRRLLSSLCGIALACAAATPASAQTNPASYPNRPVRIIVPYPAGGGADILARILSEKVRSIWDQPIVVENRSGAGGNVGTEFVFRAAPDGYTMLFTAHPPLVVNENLYKLNIEPAAFAPVAVMTVANSVLLVHPKVPANNLQEFIGYAKANPGKLNYASQGVGNVAHLAAALFNMMAGIKMVHVPYQGTSPAMADLVSGQVEVMFGELATGAPFVQAGTLRMLGYAGEKRHPEWPDVPAISEILANYLARSFIGMVAPPGTPDAIASKWATAMNDVLKMPDVTDRLYRMGLNPMGGTSQAMDRFMRGERERWGSVIRVSGAKIERSD